MNLLKTFSSKKVPKLTKWIYGISGISRDAVDTLVSIFYIVYIQYSGVLDANPSAYASQLAVIIGFLFFARLWDGINDPIIGSLIANAHSKMGKFKPWILLGAFISSVLLILLFVVRPTGWAFVFFFMVVYLLWEFSFTLNDIAYWSMLPSLTSETKERNEITSLVTLFASIGAMAIVTIVPLTVAGNAADQYGLIATLTAVVFLLSQSVLFIFAQERTQADTTFLKVKKVQRLEMYKTWIQNKPLFWIVWVLLLYYTGASIINNFGLTYFYLSLGYDAGGALLPVLAVVFALSTILTQSLYPRLTRMMTRKTLVHVSFGLLLVGYGLFYLLGSFGTLALIPVQPIFLIPIGFLIFSGQSIFYVTLMVMLSNTVEYNELKTGLRNESVIYSLRPLTAKIAASIQSGFVYVFLLISGVFSVTSQISSLENDRNNGLLTGAEVVDLANALIQEFQNTYDWGLTIFKSGMILVPMVLFALAYWILNHRVNLDEKTYDKILKELKQKKQPN